MAVKIKLKRMGKIRTPHYRIIVADSRTRRDGRAIEEIGLYNPKVEPSLIKVDSERVQYWLGVGAQPTDPVMAILKITGDWQKFKGLPGAEGTLKVAEPKTAKRAAFDAALAEVHGEPKDKATTPKKKTTKKTAAKKAASSDDKAASSDDKAASSDDKAASSDDKAASSDEKAESAGDDAKAKTDDQAPTAKKASSRTKKAASTPENAPEAEAAGEASGDEA